MTTTATLTNPTGEPRPARALLSNADFRLIRAALTTHARTTEDDGELSRIAALYHRLGSYHR